MKPTMTGRLLWCGVIACAALSTTRPAMADYSNTVRALGPVAYYRLNETGAPPMPEMATNSGTAGIAGYGYYAGATHPEGGALVGNPSDTAAGFTGGTKVTIPYQAALNPTGPFTVECWAMKAAGSGYPLGAFSALNYVGGNERQGWLFYDNDANWNFRMGDAGGYIVNITGGTAAVGQWYHLVGVFNGTTAILYVNGAAVNSAAPSRPYTGNPAYATEIGTASAFGRNFSGIIDEAVIYTNALSAAEVLAHYQNGINPSPTTPYSQLVLAQNPVGYWRLNEPAYTPPDPSTLPVVANSGTLGTDAIGTVSPGVTMGAAGPPYSGFGVNNYACQLSGFVGNIGLGAPDGLNFAGPITLMAWVKPTATGGLRNMIAHGYTQTVANQEIFFRMNGANYEVGSWESGSTGTSTGIAAQDLGQWVFMAATYDGAAWNIYRYGELIASTTVGGGSAVFLDPATPWSIGSRGDPSSDGRFFSGTMDEVAIFNRGLTQAEIRQVLGAANMPPVILTQPPATTTVNMGTPVNLSVLAVGSPTLTYQWTKEGAPIPGKTSATLAFASTVVADSGNYAVIVTNNYGAVTSSVAALTVNLVPAAFVRAVGYPAYNPATQAGSLTQVILDFSAPLDPSAITTPANYVITSGSLTLSVTAATFTNLNQTVVLTTSPQAQAQLYTVTLNNIVDATGRTLSSPTNTAQFTSWVASPAGGVHCEVYYGDTTTAVASLTNSSSYPNDPAFVTNIYAFDSRVFYPDDTIEYYGVRMSTVFTPPISGNWRFYLRSDDLSELWINPAGPARSGRQPIIRSTACCGDWTSWQSGLIPLVAGQSYYLELLYKEGGGGDYGKVAAYLEGTTPVLGTANTVVDPAALAGPAVGYPYSPADVGGPLSIVGPTDLTVQANHQASFYVSATGPEGQDISYQWKRNGGNIAGATGTSYSLIAAAADNNAQFSVQVTKIGSVVVTPVATLTVAPDTDQPTVVSVRGSTSLNAVVVTFSELVDPTSAQTKENYTVAGYTVTSAVLDSTGTRVTLTLDPPLPPGLVSTLAIANVGDQSGHTMAAVSPPLRAFVLSRGLLQFDYFGQVPSTPTATVGNIGTLINDPRFPNSPDWTTFIAGGFDSRLIFPDDTHEAYGARVSGVFIPPTLGSYMFYLRSDDMSVLNLNETGSDPALKSQVQEETGCCHGFSTLPAGPYSMAAAQMYFIEAFLKEGWGGDFVQVASKLETDPADPDRLLPIQASWVGVLADPEGASITITQQPANATGVYVGAKLNEDFSAGDGGFMVANYGSPVGPWSYNSATMSWTNFGPANCGGPFGSGLRTPVLSVMASGTVTLTFAHRHSFEGGNYDGGQVRLSVNGGPFATVPTASFTANGYGGAMVGNILAAISGTPGWLNEAFLNDSAGYGTGAFLTSTATLGTFNAGDRLQVEFLAVWDECTEGTEPNWEITSVRVDGGGAVLPAVVSLTVGVESTYQNQPNSAVAYFWQSDTGSGFTDIGGPSVATLPLYAGLTDSGTRYRCLVYSPGASATSEVATVTVTLPLSITPTGPSTLTLRWPLPTVPLTATSFVLEKSETLATGSWTTVPTGTYQTDATSVFVPVTVAPTDPPAFYRLRRN